MSESKVMSYNSGSSNCYQSAIKTLCFCNQDARMSTAHTSANYGRRFLGCANFKSRNRCNFFAWVDAPFQPQASSVIQRLVKQKMDRQETVKVLEESLKGKEWQMCKKGQGNRLELFLGLGLGFVVVLLGTYVISNM